MAMAESDEDNAILLNLANGVAPTAVRYKFDQYFPPASLTAILNKKAHNLKDLLTTQQKALLFPTRGVTSSASFDVNLMICLLRNLTSIPQPKNGFDVLPPSTEIHDGADLARVQYYINNKYKLPASEISSGWQDLEEALVRLGDANVQSMCNDFRSQDRIKYCRNIQVFQKLLAQEIVEPTIPEEIKKMGPKSVEIYTKILQSGTEKKKEIRVIIVGRKGSGKTSLAKRLLGEDAKKVESTNGIEIKKCNVSEKDGKWMKRTGVHTCSSRLLREIVCHFEKTNPSLGRNLYENQLTSSSNSLNKEDHSLATDESAEENQLASRSNSLNKDHSLPMDKSAEGGNIPGHSRDQILDKKVKDHLQTVINARLPKEESINLIFWDFAGDKEFYNSHQIFLAKDAIYLLVTKLDESSLHQGALNFWFNSVHCFCEPSPDKNNLLHPPIIVVGTHVDQYDDIKDCQSIMQKQIDKLPYKVKQHITEIVLFSNTQGSTDELNSLREKIIRTAELSKNWNKELPVKFILLEEELQCQRKSGKPILSFDEIERIAKDTLQPILERDQLQLFLQYHHDIGRLIYYTDIPDCIVLDPQWLADAVRCIITAKKYRLDLPQFEWREVCSTGRLDKKLLDAIFAKQSQYIRDNKDYLVKLMEKFNILVRPRTMSDTNVIEQNSEYYVPCLVKTMALKDVDEKFQVPVIKSKSMCFCISFDFLPPMLFNHLLIACCYKSGFTSATFKKDGERRPAFFQDIAVFNISPNGCEKLLLAKNEYVIQLQVWRYEEVQKSSYHEIRRFVVEEINRVKERFRLTNITYKEKMKCSETKYDNLIGITNYIKDPSIKNFLCNEHDVIHKFTDDWFDIEGDENLSTEELNFTRIGIITLNILADALYDRLNLDNPSVQQRSDYDITLLYRDLRQQNLHIPSDGHWGGRNKQIVEDILASHTGIGDDIERIRLIRNEMQHSKSFSLSNVRCGELFQVAKDILQRFDDHNKPGNSYCDKAETVKRKTYTKYDHQQVMEKCIKEDQNRHQYTANKMVFNYYFGENIKTN